MKNFFCLFPFLFTLCCTTDLNTPESELPVAGVITDSLENSMVVDLQIIPEILPLHQNLSEYEVMTSYFIADTITGDFENLIGHTRAWTDRWPLMYAATDDYRFKGELAWNDSTVVIPFFTTKNKEVQIFTKWKITENDSLSYLGKLKPALNSKYSFYRILEKVTVDDQLYLIGNTTGGQGSNSWQILWTAPMNEAEDFRKTDHYGIKLKEASYSRSLQHQLDGNQLNIILNVDSLVNQKDGGGEVLIERTVVKQIELGSLDRRFRNVF